MLPRPWKLSHQTLKAGAMLWKRATRMRAEAKPAAKLFGLGLMEGRYRKPEPAECSGMTNMSYLPGGRPEDLGAWPWGGGGGGGPLISVAQLCTHQGTGDEAVARVEISVELWGARVSHEAVRMVGSY